MGRFVVGDVVAVQFPFSDLSASKLRPALVLALAEMDNVILCQITSKAYASKRAKKIEKSDFRQGSLPITSYVRPDKLFTAGPTIVQKIVGRLDDDSCDLILENVRGLFVR